MEGAITPLEISIPRPVRSVTVAYIFSALLLILVLVAVYNLVNWDAVIASTLWLLLVGAGLFASYKEREATSILTQFLAPFARKQFAKTVYSDGKQGEIQFGYEILRHRRLFRAISVDKIESVSWSAGQASDMAGRDMNDWSVALWFDHDDPLKSQKGSGFRKPNQDIYIVGPTGKHTDIAAFGLKLVDYLRQSGACLVAGENDSTFVRRAEET